MQPATLLLWHADARTARAVEVALALAHDLTVAESLGAVSQAMAGPPPPDLIVCELTETSLIAAQDWADRAAETSVIFTYDAVRSHLVARALRGGAAYCVPTPLDADVLRVLVHRCLEHRDARRTADRAARRIARELAEASRLQQGMLPAGECRLSGSGASVALRCRPCVELGGDLADYADAGPRAVALLIADVSGHGAPAAMLTALIRQAFHSAAPAGYPPAAVIATLAASVAPFGDGRFVTLVAARVDAGRGLIEYVNAGHPAPLVFRQGRILARLHPTGPLVSGAYPEADWDIATAPLPPNSGILFYTDGVPEAAGDDGYFGIERLEEAIARHRGGGAALLDGLLGSVDAFTLGHPLEDDVTLLTLSVGLPGLG